MVPTESEDEVLWDEVLEKAEARLFPTDCGQWHSVVGRDCLVLREDALSPFLWDNDHWLTYEEATEFRCRSSSSTLSEGTP